MHSNRNGFKIKYPWDSKQRLNSQFFCSLRTVGGGREGRERWESTGGPEARRGGETSRRCEEKAQGLSSFLTISSCPDQEMLNNSLFNKMPHLGQVYPKSLDFKPQSRTEGISVKVKGLLSFIDCVWSRRNSLHGTQKLQLWSRNH